jgi:RNA polymerase sigma-70 factor (ECF subfamily)
MPEQGSVDSDAATIATRRDLERAMVDLTEAERAAIHQCFYNDLSHDEAAYVLQMPLGTLKTHVLRAKEKMRQRLAAYAAAPGLKSGNTREAAVESREQGTLI